MYNQNSFGNFGKHMSFGGHTFLADIPITETHLQTAVPNLLHQHQQPQHQSSYNAIQQQMVYKSIIPPHFRTRNPSSQGNQTLQ